MNVFDSLYAVGSVSSEAKKQIAACIGFFRCETVKSECEVCSIQQQKGSNDCGAFAVVFATSLCAGEDPINMH